CSILSLLFLQSSGDRRDLHSFPTRRSSDLTGELWDAELSDPEAVETERLDGKASDRIEPDVGEEERARVLAQPWAQPGNQEHEEDRKSTRLNSSHDQISYAVFCLKKKKKKK